MESQDSAGLIELQKIELEIATLIELERDIVKIYYKEVDKEIDYDMAQKQTKAICEMRQNKPCYIILNFSGVDVVFSNRARDHFATDPAYAAIRLSQALIIDGLAQKIVANFYKSFHKPSCPVEIFSNERDAILWTLSLQS